MTQLVEAIVVCPRAPAQRKERNCDRGAAWIVSLIVHAAILAALGVTMPRLPQGGTGGGQGGGQGIVLTAQFGAMSPSYLHEAATSRIELVNSAPALLAIPMAPQPMQAKRPRPPDIALASATEAIPAEPSLLSPSSGSATSSNFPGGARDGRSQTQLFGVPGKGTRFVYVFDRSASMEGIRLAAAKQELIASLHALETRHQFQVIFYGQQPEVMQLGPRGGLRLVMADERCKRIAEQFIRGIIADGPTYHLPALEMALSMQPDVIFFLTDADEPQMTAAELAHIRRLNRGTVINTIEFGAGPRTANYNFLQALAEENGGQHGYVDVGRLLR